MTVSHSPGGVTVGASGVGRGGWLALVPTACVGAFALASLRHTGSLAFPIDDGYIYSNYVLAAAQGHPFTYNLGQVSGGVTGLGWYILCTLSYWLLAPFHSLLGGLAPAPIPHGTELARQAGRLYLSAYLPGAISLVATSLGTRRLALLSLPGPGGSFRSAVCWLAGAVAAADLGLVWGAMSGLESALAATLAVWAVCLLAQDARHGGLRWSLLLAALLPWARPDLIVVGLAGLLWLLLRATWSPANQKRVALREAGLYFLASVVGFGAMSLVYYAGWGKPLPSSFFAKVGGLRLGSRFFSAAQELVAAGRALPFVAALAAVAGSGLNWLAGSGRDDAEERAHRWTALLVLMVSVLYVAALMATLPWFGQEDRYLLPVHPFVVASFAMLAWRFARRLPVSFGPRMGMALGIVVVAMLVGADYLWATRNYVVEVRNITDAHVLPARWLTDHTPPGSLIASEPIGAVKLFSGRPTIDLVGLTTPATLGTYRDWPRAWQALHQANARYLLFYPAWFDGGPPAWAVERARFQVPDNRIAGDNVIAVYELRWDLYKP